MRPLLPSRSPFFQRGRPSFRLVGLAAALMLWACSAGTPVLHNVTPVDSRTGLPQPPSQSAAAVAPAAAQQAIDAAVFRQQIETLASDDFEGRNVGTLGEQRTVDYLRSTFRQLGLKPGNPDGTWVQDVPLTRHRSQAAATVTLRDGTAVNWKAPDQLIAWSFERQAAVDVAASDLVIVGYGVTAPEYQWDDLKGVDLKGKTVVMLINDPQVPDPQDPTRLDPAVFKGEAMTYYGRWTYKFEQAAAHGAAAALIVHETRAAAYPWSVVVNSWSRDNFDIRRAGPNPSFPPVAGWISVETARALFKASGTDFDQQKRAALSRGFQPLALGAHIQLHVNNTWDDLASHNVVARLPGSDPVQGQETIVYSAHWDHFGWDPSLPGTKHDQIFHGALDNASGVAALLQIAHAFATLPLAPRRSILFVATTAEERGLLGAQYYAEHPLYPLAQTVADINMDGMNPAGRTHDIEVVGYGNSDLDQRLVQAAALQGRVVRPDTNTASGSFYRADHFEFAKVGVPALYTKVGSDYVDKPAGFGEQRRARYTEHDYHKVTDVPDPGWDLAGAVEDARLLFQVGYGLAQDGTWPRWARDSEFRARRP